MEATKILLEHKATKGGKHAIKMWLDVDHHTIDIVEYTNGSQQWASTGYTTRDYAYAAWARVVNNRRCDDGINYRPIGS